MTNSLDKNVQFGLGGHGVKGMGPDVWVRRGLAPEAGEINRNVPYQRIATEEAWTFPELTAAHIELFESGRRPDDSVLAMASLFAANQPLQDMLSDLGEKRIAHMNDYGIDRQLLLLTSPGVQVLEPEVGTAMARLANDKAAAACKKYPDRFSALAAFAPQDIEGSVAEINRAMQELKLNGAVLNSHWQGHYLDEPECAPILAALEANDAALYIHPTMPWNNHSYDNYGMGGALGGFPHDVWVHTMRLILSGAFDKYPKLRLVIGHMGEAMPLHLYRFDWMQWNAEGATGMHNSTPKPKLKHPISYYLKTNIWITTSGVAWEPAVKFSMEVLGADRVLYAMDYPYQQSPDEVASYDKMAISDEHKKMLMQENAQHVFRLP